MTSSPSKPRTRSRRAGFSLVELVMVLTIMAILAGIAAPRYGRASARYGADAAARRLVAHLLQVQQRARAASGAASVSFTAGSGVYVTTNPTVGGVAGTISQANLSLPPYNAKVSTVTFGGATSVSFDGYGTPSSDGTITVTSGSETRQINVVAATGTIKLG